MLKVGQKVRIKSREALARQFGVQSGVRAAIAGYPSITKAMWEHCGKTATIKGLTELGYAWIKGWAWSENMLEILTPISPSQLQMASREVYITHMMTYDLFKCLSQVQTIRADGTTKSHTAFEVFGAMFPHGCTYCHYAMQQSHRDIGKNTCKFCPGADMVWPKEERQNDGCMCMSQGSLYRRMTRDNVTVAEFREAAAEIANRALAAAEAMLEIPEEQCAAPQKYADAYWDKRLPHDLPEGIKQAIKSVYASYPVMCMPQGLADPMYILNTLAFALGAGDGCGKFFAVSKIHPY